MNNSNNILLSKLSKFFTFNLFIFISININAAPRTDVDIDDDGLIEIYTLSDLDSIRNNLNGSSFSDGGDNVANTAGCAEGGTGVCNGYELMNDLDFDTDGSGDFSLSDQYYNDGAGWLRIGSWIDDFDYRGIFEGNYYTINNLTINRPFENDTQGLFSSVFGGTIRNLRLDNVDIIGGNLGAGAVVGRAAGNGVTLERISVEGVVKSNETTGCIASEVISLSASELFADCDVEGANWAGGLFGEMIIGKVTNSFSLSRVQDDYGAGSLVGYITDSSVDFNYAAGTVSVSSTYAGGLFGLLFESQGNSNYWDLDTTQLTNAEGEGKVVAGTTGLSTIDMQSPIAASAPVTDGTIAYNGWDEAIWSFRSSSEYPILKWVINQIDSDGDGVLDEDDAFPFDATESSDNDSDGVGDNEDIDDDNDGVSDSEDAFPLDANESSDNDSDGIGDNADIDDDNDGVPDNEDSFPLDANESSDNDSDGIGDNADTDDDNDGVSDSEDAFPLDANESSDNDSDGIGDNADTDDDNDGVSDSEDAFPLDANESSDNDSDGIGDNADTDDDNDGISDGEDAFPLDDSESSDNDSDGVGDNADTDDDNDGMPDEWEQQYGLDPLSASDRDTDLDNDGETNFEEYQAGTDPTVANNSGGGTTPSPAPTPPPSSGSGGGSTSLLLMLMMLAYAGRRHYR